MARKGLGRGLEAILGDTPAERRAEAGGPGVGMIALSAMSPDPDQPRKQFDEDELASLADSIKAQGVLQPVLLRPAGQGAYVIIAGERRWRAAQRAGLEEIPALVREADSGSVAEIALIENVQRVDLNPIEEADAYARLRDSFGRKPQDIAAAVGKSRSHIANMLRLQSLPEDVRALVVEGQLSMGHARALLGAEKPSALAKEVVRKGLSVRETERAAAKKAVAPEEDRAAAPAKKAPRKSAGPKDADIKGLEADLEAALGLTVAIDHQGKEGGEVRIDYRTLDELDDICARLMGTGI